MESKAGGPVVSKPEGKVSNAEAFNAFCGVIVKIGIPVALISTFIVGGVKSCINENQVNADAALKNETTLLQEKGLLGQHQVVDLREVPGFDFEGKVAGGFLYTEGEFHGETVEKLKFAWKPDGKDIVVSEVPERNVRFIISGDASVEPNVQFTGIKPEKLVKDSKLNQSDNVNDFIDNVAADQITVITLSNQAWQNFSATSAK